MTVDPDATGPDTEAVPVDTVPDKPVPEGAEADVLDQGFVVVDDEEAYPHVAEQRDD